MDEDDVSGVLEIRKELAMFRLQMNADMALLRIEVRNINKMLSVLVQRFGIEEEQKEAAGGG